MDPVLPFDDVSPEEKLDHLQELVSALLDEEDNPEIAAQLEEYLAHDPDARTRYLEMAMLHADLIAYFNKSGFGDSEAVMKRIRQSVG